MNASTAPLIHVETLNLIIPPALAATADLAGRQAASWEQARPAREYQSLGGGEKISPQQALDEVAKLGNGWRLEMPHELFEQIDYGYKNQHGALSRDETLKPGYYWTGQEQPGVPGARVVVGFNGGDVLYAFVNFRAFARAVRVSGQ